MYLFYFDANIVNRACIFGETAFVHLTLVTLRYIHRQNQIRTISNAPIIGLMNRSPIHQTRKTHLKSGTLSITTHELNHMWILITITKKTILFSS